MWQSIFLKIYMTFIFILFRRLLTNGSGSATPFRMWKSLGSSVADPDPGSGIRFLFDPWIRDSGSGIVFFRISDSGSQTHVLESNIEKKNKEGLNKQNDDKSNKIWSKVFFIINCKSKLLRVFFSTCIACSKKCIPIPQYLSVWGLIISFTIKKNTKIYLMRSPLV